MRHAKALALLCGFGLVLTGSGAGSLAAEPPIVQMLEIPQPSQPSAPAAPAGSGGEAGRPVSFTAAQADRGHQVYSAECQNCHGSNLDNGEFGGPPLKGNAFRTKWFGTSVAALYGFISSAMPPGQPGKLSPQQDADVTAYILEANGVQAGSSELPPDVAALSEMSVK